MDDIPESSTTLAWLWIIEALASFKEIDFSILHDVIESAPELPDEEGKNAREVVAFRCLEGLFSRTRVIGKNDAPAQDSKIRFDLSESSEDVLQRILDATSESDIRMGGPGMLRWDVSQFISHKDACMPKCDLQQLKDTMLDDTHPYADLLKEKSGIAWMDKNVNSSAEYGDCNGVKRSSKSDDLGAQSKLVLQHQNGNPNTSLVEGDHLGGESLISKKRRLKFPSTIVIDNYKESHDVICGADCDDIPMNAKKQKQFSGHCIDSDELDQAMLSGKKVTEVSSDKVVSTGETQECHLMEDQVVSSDKCTDRKDFDGKCDSPKNSRHDDNFFEDKLGNTSASVIAQEACGGEAHQGTGVIEVLKKPNVLSHDHDQEQVCADQMEVDMDHSIETEILIDSDGYHDEQLGVIKEKNKFLSSQCSINDDSSLLTDWTELHFCMKCNEGGQLLYCNNRTCLLAVHTQCLGIFASSNKKGEFYCPFCTYSLAMSEHLDAKKKASLVKRELAAFIHNIESSQNRNDKRDKDRGASSDFVNAQPREIDAALTREAIGNIVGRKDGDGRMAQEPSFVNETDKPADQEDTYSKVDRYVSNENIGNKILLPDRGREEAGLQLVVYQQKEVDVADRPIYARNTGEDSSESDDESTQCKYSIRFREPNDHYTYPPSFQSRRTKIHWTSEEEEALKEGVEKFFTVHHRSIPWMKILEFGRAVFFKGRTAVDLKDKWRNMSKSQS